MFSKKSVVSILGLGFLLTVTSSCGLRVGDAVNEGMNFEVSGVDSDCVAQFGEALSKFVKGVRGGDVELIRVTDCSTEALRQFSTQARGAQAGEYGKDELRSFISKFFASREIPVHLSNEIMNLKQALLGGRSDRITLDELNRLVDFLNLLKSYSRELFPYLPLTADHLGNLSVEELEPGLNVLQRLANQIANLVAPTASEYPLSQLQTLLHEIRGFLGSGEWGNRMDWFERNVFPFLEPTKAILLGTPDEQSDRVTVEEWRSVFEVGAQWIGLSLRLQNYWTRFGGRGSHETVDRYLHGEGLVELSRLVDLTKALVDEVVLRQRDARGRGEPQVIPFRKIDRLVDVFGSKGMLPLIVNERTHAIIKGSTIKQLVSHIFGEAFNRIPGSINRRRVSGVSSRSISNLQKALWRFVETQRFASTLFFESGATLETLGQVEIPRQALLRAAQLNQEVFIQTVEPPAERRTIAREAVEDMITMLSNRELRPFFPTGQNKMYFPDLRSTERDGHGFVSLAVMLSFRQLVRLMVQSYGDHDVNHTLARGMPQQVFEDFYQNFKTFGRDIKIFDPEYEDTARKRFQEGDLFTYYSNGDGRIDLNEAMSLLGILLSGKFMSEALHAEIKRREDIWVQSHPGDYRCSSNRGTGPFGRPLISDHCYRLGFLEVLEEAGRILQRIRRWEQRGILDPVSQLSEPDRKIWKIWQGMPGLLKMFQDFSDEQRSEFLSLLEQTTRRGDYRDRNSVNSGETDSIVVFLNYIESMILRFDADHSGSLDLGEVLVAFNVFQPRLVQLPALQGETDPNEKIYKAKVGFTYLIQFGPYEESSNFMGQAWNVIKDYFSGDEEVTIETWYLWGSDEEGWYDNNFRPADRNRILNVIALLKDMVPAN